MLTFLLSLESVLNCPSCRKTVAPDEVICPHCDHVLDPSYFSDEPDTEEADAREVEPESRRSKTPAASPRFTPPAPSEAVERQSALRTSNVASGDRSLEALSELWEDAKEVYRRAAILERVVLVGFLVVLCATVLPWRETALSGSTLGIGTWGALAVIFSFGAAGVLAVRLLDTWPWLPRASLSSLQLTLAILAVILCAAFIRGAWDETLVPGFALGSRVPASQPSLGAFIALLGGLAQIAATGVAMIVPRGNERDG
ncbi:MAG: hypothetical protein ACKVPX_15870 [Myxococcaceae bacterium]